MHDEGQVQHAIDRTDWPPGPWDDEPEDRWEGRHAGFPVLAVRNSMGNWCGYVGVPPGHPWRERNYDDLDVQVHGGLTYAAPCQADGPICHVPGMMKFQTPGSHHDRDVYRSLEYVQQQTRALADQAAAAR